jgi:hypothetical protein
METQDGLRENDYRTFAQRGDVFAEPVWLLAPGMIGTVVIPLSLDADTERDCYRMFLCSQWRIFFLYFGILHVG